MRQHLQRQPRRKARGTGLRQQDGTVLTNTLIALHVFITQRKSRGPRSLRPVSGRQRTNSGHHPVERPRQINRCRTRCRQPVPTLHEQTIGLVRQGLKFRSIRLRHPCFGCMRVRRKASLMQYKRKPEGSNCTNQRCTTNLHVSDGIETGAGTVQCNVAALKGQPRLIERPYKPGRFHIQRS
jgi:hypothetical protein